ncbi:MAG: TolB family protein [Gemmatimonadota bacterium]
MTGGRRIASLLLAATSVAGCSDGARAKEEEPSRSAASDAFADAGAGVPSLRVEAETHLRNIRQLTFGGQNAEAYFSADGERLIFQATPRGAHCDQQYTIRVDGTGLRRVSTGAGRTTCGYFFPGGERILFSSTHLAGKACPPPPDYSMGYVWAVYPGYDIFVADTDGSNLTRLTDTPGYDAEATISRDGEWIVFTSVRDGDLDIYKMRSDGRDVRRLTDEEGYDGGPFFSYDGSQIVYRAHHPSEEEVLAEYRALLRLNLVRPTQLEIFVMNEDGTGKRQLTDNGAANFGPYFFPDGKRIIFASNLENPRGREFDLYAIAVDGTGLERITHHPDFDGFPMFDSEGSRLVWASNRNNELEGETNLFMADWVD